MKIQIRAKLRPFSHTPGTSCVIPGTDTILTAFPTRLIIDQHEVLFPITGPVKNFTICQDLERDCVFVFGSAKEGYFKLKITANKNGFELDAQKGPIKSVKIPAKLKLAEEKPLERLSLGSHQIQDWDIVKKRKDLKEIVPILFFLGQKIPIAKAASLGTASLLPLPSSRNDLEAALLAFIQAGFSSLLVPRLFDDEYQGLVDDKGKGDPFYLLQEGIKEIRSLFFKSSENTLSFLPNLPIHFDAGRMLNLDAPGIGTIDIEWSKKILKKVILKASHTKEIKLDLQKDIKRFRIDKSSVIKRDDSIKITENKIYFLDRFQK